MPDPTELVVIHRVFRREASFLLRFVLAARPGDTRRAAQVAAAIRDYTDALLQHCRLEDDLVRPLLHARARLYDEQVNRMHEQHARLEKGLLTIGDLLPHWELTATDETQDELGEHLAEHRLLLVEHLDDEEEMILPLIAEYLTPAEFSQVARDQATPALGALLEEASMAERKTLLSRLPFADRALWWVSGRHRYARRVAELREPRD
ncbi:hemerythrin domain-containing protein [Actinoplanes solisilvae]|uniref:hemerythrin domain-containing protein n=1 Tax=Actinoplanes solisilvae TaxID=2486853 RepID=UPI000FDB3399|nr:hemerythrin domain-containing protein [Actinoplanes solisilvae]